MHKTTAAGQKAGQWHAPQQNGFQTPGRTEGTDKDVDTIDRPTVDDDGQQCDSSSTLLLKRHLWNIKAFEFKNANDVHFRDANQLKHINQSSTNDEK